MANEGGGHLLSGIADKQPRIVVGTTAFPDTVDAARQLFEWLGFRGDVEFVAHPDGRVVVFHIPSKPRRTAYHHDGKYLMRAGDSLVPMSEDHLRGYLPKESPTYWRNTQVRLSISCCRRKSTWRDPDGLAEAFSLLKRAAGRQL